MRCAQLDAFRSLCKCDSEQSCLRRLADNYRPVQPLNGRSVVASFRKRCSILYSYKLYCVQAVQPRTSALNVTLPAARVPAAIVDRYLLPAPELSRKPAARRCCCRSAGHTDDGGTPDRYIDRYIPHTIQAASITVLHVDIL